VDHPHETSDRLPARSRRWAHIGGAWLEASIDYSTAKSDLFDLALSLRAAGGPVISPALQERYTGVSLDPAHPRYAPRVLAGSEIAWLVGALGADDEPVPAAAAPPEPRARPRSRRLPRPVVSRRTRQVAGALALLSLLFPGFFLISTGARADGGITGSTVVTAPTVPSRDPTVTTATTPTATTPTVTSPVPTDTTPTTTTATTPTETTPTEATPTDTTPTDTTPTTPTDTTGDDGNPEGNGPPTVHAPKAPSERPKAGTKKKTAPASAAKKDAKKKKKKQVKAPDGQILTLPGALSDPTPPNLRLRPGFAANLEAEAVASHANWALMLGVIRMQGGIGSSPASTDSLTTLASRLDSYGAATDPRAAARAVLGTDSDASHALALMNYYNAVGLPTLVRGLEWAKPMLEQKVLADPRVNIYPGGRQDISNDRVDVRVLATIEYLAQTYDEVTVSCLITGHGLYARPGVVSAHIYGLAVDIAAVKNVAIAGHQYKNGITESAVRSILMLPPEMQPNQVISLLDLGGPSFALANHWDHIHVGFAPVPYTLTDGETLVPSQNMSLLQLWQAAGQTYGVPWQVLAAINKIESNYGQNMGPSSAGAVGWMQFLPSTWAKWGTDANGDGVANPSDPADAIYSAARYLSAAGASTDLPRAIYSYNHAQWYVNEVLQLATLFGDDGAGTYSGLYGTFSTNDAEVAPVQRNLRLAPDPPLSAYGVRAHAVDTTARGLPMLAQDNSYATGVSTLIDLIGTAQNSLPDAGSTVDLNARSTAFHTLAGEPAAAFQLGVRRSFADASVLANLPKALVPLGLLDDVTLAAPAAADDAATRTLATSTP
jgi:hypothetical protein